MYELEEPVHRARDFRPDLEAPAIGTRVRKGANQEVQPGAVDELELREVQPDGTPLAPKAREAILEHARRGEVELALEAKLNLPLDLALVDLEVRMSHHAQMIRQAPTIRIAVNHRADDIRKLTGNRADSG